MRLPDASESNPCTWYVRAVWQRVGGVWYTNKQAEVASSMGISLATLKRYLSKEGTCPYPIQFALESLAGMSKAGNVYTVEGNPKFCAELLPFAGGGSGSTYVYIALTSEELSALEDLATSFGFMFGYDVSVDRAKFDVK